MLHRRWSWLGAPLLACTIESGGTGFRQHVGLPPLSETAATMDSSGSGTADDAGVSSGPEEEPTTDEVPAKSFRDAEEPLDVFTRGCLAEYSDAACGTKTTVHADRCYRVDPDTGEWNQPAPRELIEVYTYDDEEGEECAKDACCPAFTEKIVNCWQECQITGNPEGGVCSELPVCAEDEAAHQGCAKVPCFGATPTAAKCNCVASVAARDSDGLDPETRGCVTKYADAECGGATTYATDECVSDMVTEIFARSSDVGQNLGAGACGTLWDEQINCHTRCTNKGHKSGTCEEAMIACGPGMMMSGKCVCTG